MSCNLARSRKEWCLIKCAKPSPSVSVKSIIRNMCSIINTGWRKPVKKKEMYNFQSPSLCVTTDWAHK